MPGGRQTSFGERNDSSGRGNVEHGGMLGIALALFEQRQQRHCEVELTLDVEVEYLIPTLVLWEIAHGCAPSETRVVDQDVESGLGLFDLVSERITTCLAAHIGLKRYTETFFTLGIVGSELTELLGHVLQIRELATGNVDLGTVADIGGGDHLANTRATTGDKGDLSIKREEALSTKLRHHFGSCVLGHCVDVDSFRSGMVKELIRVEHGNEQEARRCPCQI